MRFYEEKDGLLEWEGYGDFQASDVHKQVAISFKTPRYKSLEVREYHLLSASGNDILHRLSCFRNLRNFNRTSLSAAGLL